MRMIGMQIIIEVEMTKMQKKYYRGTFDRNVRSVGYPNLAFSFPAVFYLHCRC